MFGTHVVEMPAEACDCAFEVWVPGFSGDGECAVLFEGFDSVRIWLEGMGERGEKTNSLVPHWSASNQTGWRAFQSLGSSPSK